MSDINPEQLSKFQKRLKEASRAKPPLYSVEDVVTKSFGLIDQARQRNVPWQDITQMLNESIGKELGFRTVKFYYFKVQKALKDGTDQTQTAPRPKAQANTRKPKTQTQAEAEVQDTAPTSAQVSAQAIAPSDQPAQPAQLEQSEPQREKGIIAVLNGFNVQPETEDPSLTESSAPKKSLFNFNTVRAD